LSRTWQAHPSQCGRVTKGLCREVVAEKIKSTGKKLRLLAKLIQLGNLSYKLPKVKFKNSRIKFQAVQILEVISNNVNLAYRLPCKVALYTGMRKGHTLGLRKKYVDLKGRVISFNIN
jgi:integrase